MIILQQTRGNLSSGDQLSLDLPFAETKSINARIGPNPTFTRASSATFVGSNGLIQTAAVNDPRFDHTSAGVCRGLLIEESRTNICLQSENLATTWSAFGITISSDFATSPDGLTTADKIVENTANSFHGIFQIPNTVSGVTYTGSCYIKAAGRNFALIYTGASPANGRYISIPADGTGTVLGLYNANPANVSLKYVGNGWYRVSILFVSSGAGSSLEIYASTNGTTSSYTGDGTSGILVWGAQLEAGSFATSYIPTTTGSVVRSADVCSITGANFTSFWNTNEGAMFASGDPIGIASAAVLVMANSGANANQIAFDRSTTTIKFGVANSGTYTATIQQNSTNGSFVKISGAYATNNARSALNGVLGTPDTSVIVPTNLNRFNIGSAGAASTEFANGCISAIKYFRKPLSNAKLQALTV